MNQQPEFIARTRNPDCPACQRRRLDQPEEWKQHHPLAGTGFHGAHGKPRESEAQPQQQ